LEIRKLLSTTELSDFRSLLSAERKIYGPNADNQAQILLKVCEKFLNEIDSKISSKLEIAYDHLLGPILFPSYDIVILPRINRFGFWENQEAKFISKNIPSGGVFLNIGSNIGYHLLGTKFRRPDVKVFGVEPHPLMINLAQMNSIISDIDYELYEFAITEKNGEVDLYSSTYNVGDSRIYAFSGAGTKIRVKSATGSYIFEQLPKKPDLILIDTQGTEFEVLKSLDIESLDNSVIIFELTPNWYTSLSECQKELIELESMGWQISYLKLGIELQINSAFIFNLFNSDQDLEYLNLILRKN
jgi:FkbM family methyltransferase